ncbi:uncharacterized protein LOC135957399 [Calliphora vicina]|uniref:uncharacterized protein LOC135957399 n=1 Tax=Calliphora vicina TaxID=7373 RepID=UPI00325B8B8E
MDNVTDDSLKEMEIDIPVAYVKQLKIWSNSETKQLLSLYKSLLPEVGQRFTYQKQMFDEISLHFPDKTPQQCQSRLTTMFRKKKRGAGKVYNISGAGKNTTDLVSKDDTNAFRIIKLHNVEPDDNLLTPIRNFQLWSNSETKQLVDLYKRFIGDVGPDKRFTQKKEMWAEISAHFPNKEPKQCETRFMRLLNKQKNRVVKYVRYNPSETRRKRNDKAKDKSSFQINRKHTIKKERITDDMDQNELDIPEHSEPNIQKKNELVDSAKKEKTIQETLMDIAARKEETKERRHKEKMEVFKQVQNILQQLLDSKNN